MQTLKVIGIAFVAGVIGALCVARTPSFGTTLTTIQGSDTLSNSRSTINSNFTALLNGKVEISDIQSTSTLAITTLSSLTTVGTLTSGSLGAGFTTVAVARGGTGSTTPTTILCGNGSGTYSSIGWGTTNQVLVSNGATNCPSWSSTSFDTTLSYNLTGTIRIKTLIASSTITFSNGGSGQAFIFPTSVGSANSCLSDNGSGTLTFQTFCKTTVSVDTTSPSIAVNASTTIKTVTIAANTLSTTQALRVESTWHNDSGNTCTFSVYLGTGSATTSLGSTLTGDDVLGIIEGQIYATSTSAENSAFRSAKYNNTATVGNNVPTFTGTHALMTYSTTGTLYLAFEGKSSNSSPCHLVGETVEVLKN